MSTHNVPYQYKKKVTRRYIHVIYFCLQLYDFQIPRVMMSLKRARPTESAVGAGDIVLWIFVSQAIISSFGDGSTETEILSESAIEPKATNQTANKSTEDTCICKKQIMFLFIS